MTATVERTPAVRTRLNVRDSDATLIVWDGRTPSPGTQLTIETAQELSRPLLVASGDVAETKAWLESFGPEMALNVAGPRESNSPGTYGRTVELLRAVLV